MDPFAAVLQLPGVAETADQARKAVDSMLWDRGLRARAEELTARSALAGAAATASLEGIEVPWPAWVAGQAVDDTPVGAAAAGVELLYRELPSLRSVWETAPLQALARMHALVSAGTADDPGRPRTGDPADPLHLRDLPPAAAVPPRLQALASHVTAPTSAPALVVAAIVHAELLTLQPFTYGSGLVARAAVRLVLATRGLDPDNWSVPEAAIKAAGRPAYVRAAAAYTRADAEGVAEWVRWHCQMVADGTQGLTELLG